MRAYTSFERREHPRLRAIAGASVMLDGRSYLMSDCSEGGLLCVDYYGPRRLGDIVEMRLIAAKEDTPQQSFRLRAEVVRYDEDTRCLAVKFRLPDDQRGDTFRTFIREQLTDGQPVDDRRMGELAEPVGLKSMEADISAA
ncbi:MAG: PilZ domain-containing protein [Pseudomonadota bacterium]